MQTAELEQIAKRARFMREAGIGLLIASGMLSIFIWWPEGSRPQPPAAVAVATSTVSDAFANVPIRAKAAIVYDLTTNQVLYAKNDQAQLPLASLTKLLTVYGALSFMSSSTPITVSQEAASQGSPHAFISGDTLALADLARLTLTASLNDGAAAIAQAAASQKQETTPTLMAGTAAALGLTQTYAVNGNGLDESATLSGGYGSAHDIALLAGALVQEAPDVALATTAHTATATSLTGRYFAVTNTDPDVTTIPRLLLSKTGFTDLAGGNLALVFDAGIGHPVAVVVLGSDEKARFTDGQALVAAALAHFANVPSL